jgi:hypothetical protein
MNIFKMFLRNLYFPAKFVISRQICISPPKLYFPAKFVFSRQICIFAPPAMFLYVGLKIEMTC